MTDRTTICSYDNVKIYSMNAEDNQFRLGRLDESNATLEVYITELSNYLFLALFSSNANKSISKKIYLDIKLDLLNVQIKRGEVELKYKDKRLKNYYSIEFNELDAFKDILDNVASQNESTELDSLKDIDSNTDDFEDVQELAKKLETAISKGQLEESSLYARKLAQLRADLRIELKQNIPKYSGDDSDVILDEEMHELKSPQVEQKSKLSIKYPVKGQTYKLDVEINTSKTIYQLKEEIRENYGISIDQQIIIINDCDTKNESKIDEYSLSNLKACASNIDLAKEYDIYLHVWEHSIKNNDKTVESWLCSQCNIRNLTATCSNCQNRNPKRGLEDFESKDATITDSKKKKEEEFFDLVAHYNQDLIENSEVFKCDICLENEIPIGSGVILKECLHSFCKECLRNLINYCDDPQVKCPYNQDYMCNCHIQDREIRALLSDDELEKHQFKSLRISEATMQNTVHCKTPDCIGFCVSEDNLNFFDCPVCEKVNCLRCNVIHMQQTCKEYQDDLKIKSINDESARKDQEALEKMIETKTAMYCPGCKIILCKNTGCDWLKCPMCKIEICWATRGPRWGPKGNGDTTGGCKCRAANGKLCHPTCQNCH